MVKIALAALALAAVSYCADLTPHVGEIQIFGAYKTKPAKVASALGVQVGDPLPVREEAEARLLAVPGVVASSVQIVCCAGKNMILYAGVEEKGSPHFQYHVAPADEIALPQRLLDAYDDVIANAEASMRGHNADEDLTNGYSLMADPEGRQKQEDLIPMVAENLAQINKVLRESSDPEQRQAAAYVIQYAPRAPRQAPIMIDALQYALQDPDESVRKTAIQSIQAVIIGARLHREQHLHIEPTWLVELLNSLDWSDRAAASDALVTLTDKSYPEALDLIRERAWNAVLDMARWQDLRHALPGFILAGRVAGMNKDEIAQAWEHDRDGFLREISRKKAKQS